MDLIERVTGRSEPLTPPRRLRFVGSNQFFRNDYNEIGRELMQYLVEVGEMTKDDRVLDVGCGVGRIAARLVDYLDSSGYYDGFDIVKEAVDWCTENITADHPRFRFAHADIFNAEYNPSGRRQAHEYRFPYGTAEFSYIILTSVATHVLAPDLENYLSEISRVLKLGGRCFITFFLLNPDSESQTRTGGDGLRFRHQIGEAFVERVDVPEAAVAFRETYVRSLYSRCGLEIVEPIRFGRWSGRDSDVGFQDIVIARRVESVDSRPELLRRT
jgi:SAM-dependent methyltransferase